MMELEVKVIVYAGICGNGKEVMLGSRWKQGEDRVGCWVKVN